ncbi:MAG TPA: Crp/Fnr family transcriptional regulator [Longimicrobiales bacterium]
MPLRVVPRRDRKLNAFVKKAEFRELGKKEEMWNVGDAAVHVALVRRGHVLLVDPGPSPGRERTAAVAGPWEIAGEEALVDGALRPLRAVAGEPSQVQLLAASALRAVLRSSNRTFVAFMEALASDLDVARRLGAGSAGPPARARIAAVLRDLGRRLGGEGEAPRIPIRITHRTLADLAGVHRSTVTTVLNDWIYAGLLGEAEIGVRILDPEGLRKAATARSPRRGTR